MPDEFGTVNVRRGERAREIEIIRQQYKRHRDALTSMIADAPTEHLAAEYQRLIGELDLSLMKLNELESPGIAGAPAPHRSTTDTQPIKSEPGRRRLVTPTPAAEYDVMLEEPHRGNRSLLLAIVLAGLVVLGVLGWMLWRSFSDERPDVPIVTETTEIAVPDDTGTIVNTPVPPATPPVAALRVEPSSHDFGTIRKGTRAVRQFEVSNSTDQPITISVTRSTCRCLYYSHSPVVPPRGRETITVTVDAVRARAGSLQETVQVTAKGNTAITAPLTVSATIR
ncbi:MAG TPA: DUF1573 domain-containing protein [Thermoanaerobaculia bacterium]|nr:DUF1573 domain-containing protein [Thermoanaerobaculia bacterium]